MKFKFSLQKVLEHRKTLENIAQRDFQETLVAHRKELAILENMKNQRQQGFQDRFKIQTKAGKDLPPQLQQVHEYLTGQDKRIEIQKAKVQEVENLVEKMREILRQKAISFKIIEKLKEKKFRDFMTEQNCAEQKEIDEINVIRHSREDLK